MLNAHAIAWALVILLECGIPVPSYPEVYYCPTLFHTPPGPRDVSQSKRMLMKLPLKKGWLIAIVILVLLIFLNPGYNAFKEFTGLSGDNAAYLHKKANYLVFSVYENADDEKTYAGFCMNFIDITPTINEVPSATPTRAKRDTIKAVDNSYFVPDSTIKLDAEGIPIPKIYKNEDSLPIFNKPDSETIRRVQISCRLKYIVLKTISREAKEAKVYIDQQAKEGKSITLKKYINSIEDVEGGFLKTKKIPQEAKLDEDMQAFLDRLEKFYKDFQRAYATNALEKTPGIGLDYSDEIGKLGNIVLKDFQELEQEYSFSNH